MANSFGPDAALATGLLVAWRGLLTARPFWKPQECDRVEGLRSVRGRRPSRLSVPGRGVMSIATNSPSSTSSAASMRGISPASIMSGSPLGDEYLRDTGGKIPLGPLPPSEARSEARHQTIKHDRRRIVPVKRKGPSPAPVRVEHAHGDHVASAHLDVPCYV